MKDNKIKKLLIATAMPITFVMPIVSLINCNPSQPEPPDPPKPVEKYTVSLDVIGKGTIATNLIKDVVAGTKLSDLEDQINPQCEGEWELDGYYNNGVKIQDTSSFLITSNTNITVRFHIPWIFVLNQYVYQEDLLGIGAALFPPIELVLSVKQGQKYDVIANIGTDWLDPYHEGYAFQWVLIVNNVDHGEGQMSTLLKISNPKFYVDGVPQTIDTDYGVYKEEDQYKCRFEGYSSTFIRDNRGTFRFEFIAEEDCNNLVMYLFAPEYEDIP